MGWKTVLKRTQGKHTCRSSQVYGRPLAAGEVSQLMSEYGTAETRENGRIYFGSKDNK